MPREKRSIYAQQFNAEIGNRIADLRKASDLSVAELAARAYVPARVVRRIEQGLREPDVGMLLAIADALDTDAARFFDGVPRPPEAAREGWPDPQRVAEAEAFARAFCEISNDEQRRQIVALLKACVKSGLY